PREFTLVAFGGAGGLHATDLARALAMPRVYVPRHPGLLSAWGMLVAEVARDFGRTLRAIGPSDELLGRGLRELEVRGRRELAREGVRGVVVERALDVRYAGQSYELTVAAGRRWRERFHALHRERFGHADERRALEVVTLRLRARGGRGRVPEDRPLRAGSGAPLARRPVWFDGRRVTTPVFRRDDLPVGWSRPGPAVVCEYSATTLVPPGWRARVDGFGGLVLEGRSTGRSR
ncbi:MAG: hydantoinase/oxoprolinase family protein, partial [Candidatus Binatia bacterium]